MSGTILFYHIMKKSQKRDARWRTLSAKLAEDFTS